MMKRKKLKQDKWGVLRQRGTVSTTQTESTTTFLPLACREAAVDESLAPNACPHALEVDQFCYRQESGKL
jgi:hypothetical protein